jgi:hypothetical protein
MGIAVPGETEKQYDARVKRYENEIKTTRPDVKWVNAEQYAKSMKKDNNFFGHSKVNKQNIVKNPPKQPSQLGKDGFYSNVKNRTGQL